VLLVEHSLLDAGILTEAVRTVRLERERAIPPESLPTLPTSWPDRYERLATEIDLTTRTFAAADQLVRRLWAELQTSL
jgi:hypothetical protein